MKLCTIIGMGPGMGVAIARRFGREGYQVAMLARKATTLETCGATLAQAGVQAHGYVADAADVFSLCLVLEAVHAQHGNTQVLVYNAAAMKEGRPAVLTADRLVDEFRVNVSGAMTATLAILPQMKREGSGSILFTGGGLGLEPNPAWCSLSLGKAGLRSLAFSLYQELAPLNIHVGIVTICGLVGGSGHFAPEQIAESYWSLHQDASGSFRPELQYR